MALTPISPFAFVLVMACGVIDCIVRCRISLCLHTAIEMHCHCLPLWGAIVLTVAACVNLYYCQII